MPLLVRSSVLLVLMLQLSGTFTKKSGIKYKELEGPRKLRCKDENFQRTMTWKPQKCWKHKPDLKYNIQFGSVSSDVLNNLHCYEDETRREKVERLTQNYCITSVNELLPWNYLKFRVRATFTDPKVNRTMSSQYSKFTMCRPVASKSSLTSPNITVKELDKNSVDLKLFLPPELNRTLQSLGEMYVSELKIKYISCLVKKKDESDCNDCSDRKRCQEDYQELITFDKLKSNTEYYAWASYSIGYESKIDSALSEEIIFRTKRDLFEETQRISIILSLCALVVFFVIIVIAFRFVRKLWKDVRYLTKDGLSPTLVSLQNDLKARIPPSERRAIESPADLLIISYSDILQDKSLHDEEFKFEPITTQELRTSTGGEDNANQEANAATSLKNQDEPVQCDITIPTPITLEERERDPQPPPDYDPQPPPDYVKTQTQNPPCELDYSMADEESLTTDQEVQKQGSTHIEEEHNLCISPTGYNYK